MMLLFPLAAFADGIAYRVDFEGLEEGPALRMIKSVSELTGLKKHAPPSIHALKYRAESDIPDIIKVLHAYGYYEATVSMRVEETFKIAVVTVMIRSGPVYKLEDYQINLSYHDSRIICDQVQLQNMGLNLGKPAVAQDLLCAEGRLLQLLSEYGYPLASIRKREVVANGKSKQVTVHLDVDTGPLSRFGAVRYEGQTSVKPQYMEKKITWTEGEIYNSQQVECSQKSLLDTGLFSSVLITHDDILGENGAMRMKVDVTETKHRSVNIGASYQTFWGFGLGFGWENRNIHGSGRKLSIQGDVTKNSHTGLAAYAIPDFRKPGEDFVTQAAAVHEAVDPSYSMRSYSAMSRIEKKFKAGFRAALGGRLEQLYVTASVHNGEFLLAEAPLYFRWTTANNLLNPTEGWTIEYTLTPSVNLDAPKGYYMSQALTQNYYFPVDENHVFVIAQKLTLGSILYQSFDAVPVCKRFFGGSEDDLRGYRFQTVSPLKGDRKPIGGGSAVYYTLEARFRLSKSIGFVPFFDLGNVYQTKFPQFDKKWLKSLGLGLRYFSFLGPLRLDVAFPLDKRRHLDDHYRIIISIGQTF